MQSANPRLPDLGIIIIIQRRISNLCCYGWPIKDHGFDAADAKEEKNHGKSGERDPKGSILDRVPERDLGDLLVVCFLHALTDLL